MVTGGIAWRIRFGFHDAAAKPSGGKIVDDNFADEEARESDGVLRKFRAVEAADGEFCAGFVHGNEHLLTGCAARAVHEALEVVGGEEIVVFGVLAEEAGDVRTERHDAQMMGAGEIERRASELCR
jgi:hypothetical protein